MPPAKLSLREFGLVTHEIDLSDAEDRLNRCAKCRRDAVCDRPDQTHTKPGLEPYWDSGVKWRVCDKWRGYVFRKSLGAMGLEGSLAEKWIKGYQPQTEAQSDALDVCRIFIADWGDQDGSECGLLLVGSHGVGKTHLAAAVVFALVAQRKISSAWFVYVSDLLTEMRLNLRNDEAQLNIIERAATTELLIFDDLGAHNTTPWVRDNLAMIVNKRYVRRLPMIVTSNSDLDALSTTLGPRTVSRLQQMLVQVLIDGPDYRARS